MVTGGSQGIGRSIALALAAEGADVVLVARRRDPLESVAKEIEAIGTAAHVIDADVATADGAASAFAGAVDRFGARRHPREQRGQGLAQADARPRRRRLGARASSSTS